LFAIVQLQDHFLMPWWPMMVHKLNAPKSSKSSDNSQALFILPRRATAFECGDL
jgi:hypothetical protein